MSARAAEWRYQSISSEKMRCLQPRRADLGGRSIARAQQLRIFAPLATLIFAATALAQDTSKAPGASPPEVQSSQPSAARVVDLKAPDGTIL